MKTIALRFADNFAPDSGTIMEHQKLIDEIGYAWYGKLGAAISNAVAEQIKEPETLNLENLGRQMIEKALERNGGNRKKAAQELGISDRTLYRRIKQYGLE